jgi:hypothetical protein
MNYTAIATIAADLAKLTPQEHLIASELAQKLRCGGKPMPVITSQHHKRKPPFTWTDEYTAIAKELAEDVTIQSPKQRRQSLEDFATAIGTEFKVVQRKVDTIRRQSRAVAGN